MPIKEYLHEQPIQLYIIELLSIIYLILQLILSHITHSLTLQFDSYHMICKIIALTGRIITEKYSKNSNRFKNLQNVHTTSNNGTTQSTLTPNGTLKSPYHHNGNITNGLNGHKNANHNLEENKFIEESKIKPVTQKEREDYEKKLKNTFGWTRINVLTMSVIFIVLASLSFSNVIEAIKAFIHMSHKDIIHYPLPVLTCGAIGLVLDSLTYFLIGGYTIHLVNFCKFKNLSNYSSICSDIEKIKNNEILSTIKQNSEEKNMQQTIDNIRNTQVKQTQYYTNDDSIVLNENFRPGWYDIFTDISSSLLVMICGLTVHLFTTYCVDCNNGKYIDPILAISSSFILLVMIFPYMKQSCMILLQTIPGTINIQVFRKNLLEKFQEISVHDLHIWSLTSKKYVSTVHIIFKDPNLYLNTIQEIKKYFYEQGIATVSIQPEFLCAKIRSTMIPNKKNNEIIQKLPTDDKENLSTLTYNTNTNISCDNCLVPCLALACAEKSCCNINTELKEILSVSSLENINNSPCYTNIVTCQTTVASLIYNQRKLSTDGKLQEQSPSHQSKQLQTLDVNNLENIKSSHIIKFNNKCNRNLEYNLQELNGNYRLLEQNNDKNYFKNNSLQLPNNNTINGNCSSEFKVCRINVKSFQKVKN
ncbi:uncharacterized protein LOC129613593 [Condylostylus longicornis]|uniref:uncharacterized protein LOC129613593 n=1 Tax=Condylostylus longicornis TaxID=2530218 RepID=UPI00244DBE28|nr:uncharacterized protein LOC129613593 [Condylostylus longicornis]